MNKFKIFQLIGFFYKLLPSSKTNHFDLVIVRVDALGDYVLWLDALEAYKERYENKKVLLICADLVKPLAAIEPFFTEVWDFKRKRIEKDLLYFHKFIKKLRATTADIVVYPIWQRHRVGDLFVSMIKSKEKVSICSKGRKSLIMRFYDRNYTTLIKAPNFNSELSVVEYFTQKVVNSDYKYSLRKINIVNPDFIIPSQKYIVIAISASIPQKIWPMEFFAEVINLIPTSYSIILTGAGDTDNKLADFIISSIKDTSRVRSFVNKTSVLDLLSLIASSSLVIGNDSAAVHMAAVSHVPSICVLHGAHFGRFLPYPNNITNKEYHPHAIFHKMDCFGCGYHCKNDNGDTFKCLRSVEPGMVIELVEKLLSV